MTSVTEVVIDSKLDMPKAAAVHEGRAYVANRYTLPYSQGLVRTVDRLPDEYETAETGKADFYDTLKAAAVMAVASGLDIRLPLDSEEDQIYVQNTPGAKELCDVPELADYFAKSPDNWFAFGHTLTCLRFDKDQVNRKYKIGEEIPAQLIITRIPSHILTQIADPKFTHDNFKDIIKEINRVEGVVPIPYARGQVIRKTHPVFGIFEEIEETTGHDTPYALHAWLRENLNIQKDPISEQHDVAVARWSSWCHPGHSRCLDVDAYSERWDVGSNFGFRPVQGPLPKIMAIESNVDVSKLRKEITDELTAQFARDLRELMKRYPDK